MSCNGILFYSSISRAIFFTIFPAFDLNHNRFCTDLLRNFHLCKSTYNHEKIWGTVGVSDNIIEASWQALVDSIEYKLLKDEEQAE